MIARLRTGARRTATHLQPVRVRCFSTADGEFFIAIASTAEGDRLLETGWTAIRQAPSEWVASPRLAPELVARLRAAIDGEPIDFTDVAIPDATPFFHACRRFAQAIPCGATISYVELARRAGSPAASRAAGQAMRRNPTPIVVPCHRVVAANGTLGGFSGDWGAGRRVESATASCARPTDVKARLLAREAKGAKSQR